MKQTFKNEHEPSDKEEIKAWQDKPWEDRVAHLVKMDLCVFPLKENGKKPIYTGGFHQATTDAAQIKIWSEKHPRANIGIAAGLSGVFFVDIDQLPGKPNKWLDDHPKKREELYERAAYIVRTPCGGTHLGFRQPPNCDWGPTQSALYKGIDTRAGGSYVVAPGCHYVPTAEEAAKGKIGGDYTWIRMPNVHVSEMPFPPRWLADDVNATNKMNFKEKVEASRNENGKIGVGNRNGTLASIAGKLRHDGLDADMIYGALWAYNIKNFEPPLDADEVKGVADSIARYEPKIKNKFDTDNNGSADNDGGGKYEQTPIFEMRTAKDYLEQNIPVPDPIIKGVINEQEVIVMSAPQKLGKSLLGLNGGLCVTQGHDWLGFEIPKARRVMYIQAELHDGWGQVRLKKIIEHYKGLKWFEDDRLDDFIIPPPNRNFRLDNEEDVEELIALIKRYKIELIIFDPLYCMVDANENKNEEMKVPMGNALKIRDETGCSVLIVHHQGKGDHSGISVGQRSRGASVIGDSSDGNISLEEVPEENVHHEITGAHFVIMRFQMRNSESSAPLLITRELNNLVFEVCDETVSKGIGKPGPKAKTVIADPMGIVARHEGRITKASLVTKLEEGGVSRATAYRDIDKLIQGGHLIYSEGSNGKVVEIVTDLGDK